MGWFSKIFKQGSSEDAEEGSYDEELVEQTNVELARLPDWIDARLNMQFAKIKPKIEEQFNILIEQKKELFSNLEELNIAELHNPNIPAREKQIMEGNRNAYIHQHKQFMNLLDVSADINYKEASLFCKNFEDLLSKLASSTAKGHYVMKEFFADHANRINRNVKAISEAVGKVQELLRENGAETEGVSDLQKKAAELKAKKKLLSECEYELDTARKKLANSEQLKKKLLGQIEQLKKTDNYAEFEAKDKEKQELSSRLKKTDEEISSLFSPLDRPMRKFDRMLAEDTDIFAKYLQDPVTGLLADEQLKILIIMEKMRKHVEDESLGLKDKEKEKALQRITLVEREKLLEARKRHSETKQAVRKIDEDIRGNVALQELDGVQYKISHTENQIKILQDKMASLEKTKEKTNIDALKQELQDEIKQVMGVGVKIICKDSHTA